MAYGQLIFYVYNHLNESIETANITVYDTITNTLLFTLTTDAQGYSTSISLQAPNTMHSLSNTSTKPYTNYRIEANKQGFHQTIIYDLPIFPNSTSTLPIQLFPLSHNQPDSITIPPNSINEDTNHA